MLSTASFINVTWFAPELSGNVLTLAGWSSMMNISFVIYLEAESGREDVLPCISYTDFASIVSLSIQNYQYVNTEWIGKLAVEMYMPTFNVRSSHIRRR
jgi:hypothetical protein